jgi:hypothetical protein
MLLSGSIEDNFEDRPSQVEAAGDFIDVSLRHDLKIGVLAGLDEEGSVVRVVVVHDDLRALSILLLRLARGNQENCENQKSRTHPAADADDLFVGKQGGAARGGRVKARCRGRIGHHRHFSPL